MSEEELESKLTWGLLLFPKLLEELPAIMLCYDQNEPVLIDNIKDESKRLYLKIIINDIMQLKTKYKLPSLTKTIQYIFQKHILILKNVNEMSAGESLVYRSGLPRILLLLQQFPDLLSELPSFLSNLIDEKMVDISGITDDDVREELGGFLRSIGLTLDGDEDDVYHIPEGKDEMIAACLSAIQELFFVAEQYCPLAASAFIDKVNNKTHSNSHSSSKRALSTTIEQASAQDDNDDEHNHRSSKKQKKEKKEKKASKKEDKKTKHKHKRDKHRHQDHVPAQSAVSESDSDDDNSSTISYEAPVALRVIGPTMRPTQSSYTRAPAPFDDRDVDIGPSLPSFDSKYNTNTHAANVYSSLSLSTNNISVDIPQNYDLIGTADRLLMTGVEGQDGSGSSGVGAEEVDPTVREEWMLEVGENKMFTGKCVYFILHYSVWCVHR